MCLGQIQTWRDNGKNTDKVPVLMKFVFQGKKIGNKQITVNENLFSCLEQ